MIRNKIVVILGGGTSFASGIIAGQGNPWGIVAFTISFLITLCILGVEI